jgi:flagellar motility protein MotE (MotC chaperone)
MMRPRLLPVAIAAMAGLFVVKVDGLLGALRGGPAPAVVAPARAADPPAPAAAPARPPPPVSAGRPAPPPPAAVVPAPAPEADPTTAAERALLEQLRARRTEIEAREQAVVAQEVVLQATERRLARRVEELTAMQQRLEGLERSRTEREEAGWRGLVRTYEAMRPRDAAAIFNDLEMPVLVEILDRMSERKAAPVIGAMRAEQARALTTELARHRARRTAAN